MNATNVDRYPTHFIEVLLRGRKLRIRLAPTQGRFMSGSKPNFRGLPQGTADDEKRLLGRALRGADIHDIHNTGHVALALGCEDPVVLVDSADALAPTARWCLDFRGLALRDPKSFKRIVDPERVTVRGPS